MGPTAEPGKGQPAGGEALSWVIVCLGGATLLLYLTFWPSSGGREPGTAWPAKRPRLAGFAPPRAPGVETGLKDYHGNPAAANCGSCHSTRPADTSLRDPASLKQIHQGLTMKHGDLACVACHNPGDGYQSLRLADGRAVPFAESITLCAQCHGPQHRDYQHGAHGGMSGYWDTTRGPRRRNTCTACHDPHAPAYPKVNPARGPNDRFLTPPREVGHD